MSDIIRREDVIREFVKNCSIEHVDIDNVAIFYGTIMKIINSIPSAEPERKKGKWTEDSDPGQIIGKHYSCSECRACFGTLKSNFCPNCGAEMRSENE